MWSILLEKIRLFLLLVTREPLERRRTWSMSFKITLEFIIIYVIFSRRMNS